MSRNTLWFDTEGRIKLDRESIEPGQLCARCGKPAKYRYGLGSMDHPTVLIGLPFCNVRCYRTYHHYI